MSESSTVLLFDLGGVLVKIKVFDELIRLSGKDLPPQQIKDLWLHSKTVKLFETGQCDTQTFAKKLVEEFQLKTSASDFEKAFLDWMEEPYPGALELLEKLRTRFILGCLSNTNSLHFEKLEKMWNLPSYFDYTFFSHELGCLKPEKQIFEKVLKTLPKETERVLFFDDSRLNIEAAKEAGIEAYLTDGFLEAEKLLIRLFPPENYC